MGPWTPSQQRTPTSLALSPTPASCTTRAWSCQTSHLSRLAANCCCQSNCPLEVLASQHKYTIFSARTHERVSRMRCSLADCSGSMMAQRTCICRLLSTTQCPSASGRVSHPSSTSVHKTSGKRLLSFLLARTTGPHCGLPTREHSPILWPWARMIQSLLILSLQRAM